MAHFDAQLAAYKSRNPGATVSYEYLGSQNLLALQGPGAPAALATLVTGADKERVLRMPFMSGGPMTVLGIKCIVTRCGYTGEDGYEVSVPAEHAEKVARAMLACSGVEPAALGARDSLRLEAGLCLYGHDMDDQVTPGEASLVWTIGKRRRTEGGFLGAATVLGQIKDKSYRKRRVGFTVTGAPAREGAVVHAAGGGAAVGVITSGTFSPCLKAPVAMGYVPAAMAEVGTKLEVEVRGARQAVTVAKMPFVPHAYFKPSKK